MSTEVSRLYNFVNDKNSSVPITASRMDGEFDQVITKLNQKALIKSTAPSSPIEGMLWYDSTNKALKIYRNSAWDRVDTPAGSYLPYGGTTAPTGWLLCDGSAISRTTYADLFAAIGTAYGVGDGATTFNVPEMRGNFPFGKAASGTGSTLGTAFGAIDHVHTGPSHVHAGPSHTHGPGSLVTDTQVGVGAAGAGSSGGSHSHSVASGATAAGGTGNTDAGGTGNTGTGNPPGLPSNFIIKY